MTLQRCLPHLAALSLAALLTYSTAGLAADAPMAPSASTDLANVAKGDYAIDPEHTNVMFELSHMGFSTFVGRFNKTSGDLSFDTKKPQKSKIAVTIDVGSIDTKVPKLDEHLKDADFFDAAKYPDIKFKSTKVEKLTDTTGRVTGDLTMHGVTKPVTLDVTYVGGGQHPMFKKSAIGFSARGTIKRSDFGITKFVPMVGDDVTLVIETELHQK